MSVYPSNQFPRRMNPWLNLAAAAGGAASRVAVNAAMNYLSTPRAPMQPRRRPRPFNMQPMMAALPPPGPSNAQARGPRRRRRQQAGRAKPSAGVNTSNGSIMTISDTEVIGLVGKPIASFAFNPSISNLPRLTAHAKMYRRYRFKSLTISYKPGVGTATTGNLAFGIAVGAPMSTAVVKDIDTILKLRPSCYVPGWKAASFKIGSDIDLSRYMLCNDNTADGVAFTLYTAASVADLGLLQVSYNIEFSHPIPF